MEMCISGWVMLNRQAVIIEDIYSDQRIPADAYRPTFVKSMAMVPIRTSNPIGAIGNYWAEQRVPEASELSFLQALADVTAVTMENIRIYSELEQRVADRTQEFETVNKELRAFSYTVSHDLRAPLRSIQLSLEQFVIKNEKTLDTSGHLLIGRAMKKASEMKMLIDDLMDFFMMSTTGIDRKNLSMKDMVTHIAYDLQEQNASRKIIFNICDIPDAMADETLIKQVWTNLISNAIKYSGYKEESMIEIGYEEKGKSISYYVKDNGAGFSMKYYDRLFGVFQRLHSKEQFEGSGIGLALVSRAR
jgi:light-regulated signal transduction histidine kinase (bacteriophytochrome)